MGEASGRSRRRVTRGLMLLVLPLALSCEPPANTLDFTREEVAVWRATTVKPPVDAAPTKLKVMAWNVKYGAGRIDFWFDFWGDRVQLTVDEVDANMEAIYALIREYDPDILLTSEIEVNSRRSAYYDQVRGILENTDLNYAAYIQTWDARYIANEGLGRMDLGNAIHSKYPIVKAERIRQEDRTDQAPHVSLFYIHRAVGRAEVDVGSGKRVAAYVVHTEAYDNDGTKKRHLRQIHELVSQEPLDFVLGGDFNELPPLCDETKPAGDAASCEGVLRLKRFPDEPESSIGTEYEQPPYTPSVMKPFFDDFAASITLEQYGRTEAEQRPFYTHSVLGPDTVSEVTGEKGFWNRTVDYLFVRKSDVWAPDSTAVLQRPGDLGVTSDPMRLSDHAPTVGTWSLSR